MSTPHPNPRRVLVLQHAEPEHLGLIATVLTDENITYDYRRTDRGASVPGTLDGYGGLIVMGGPQSVYEEDRFPYLRAEKRLAREAVDSHLPVLGVCLGSQILADVLGARVQPGGAFELGWHDVRRDAALSDDPVLSALPDTFTPMHWHGDVYDLPEGARPVGASSVTPVQGFVYGTTVYALLFHLELTDAQIITMAEAFPDDVRRGGVEADTLIRETPARVAVIRAPALEVFRRWARLIA